MQGMHKINKAKKNNIDTNIALRDNEIERYGFITVIPA